MSRIDQPHIRKGEAWRGRVTSLVGNIEKARRHPGSLDVGFHRLLGSDPNGLSDPGRWDRATPFRAGALAPWNLHLADSILQSDG